MEQPVIIVTRPQSAFARHAQTLGWQIARIDDASPSLAPCNAFFWEQSAMRDSISRSQIQRMLASLPKDCDKILDFDLYDITYSDRELANASLSDCDILRIAFRELQELCRLFGIQSRHAFDCGFELMAAFDIETLILNHDRQGCQVFHGNAVSEKWGHLPLGKCNQKEAEGAFAAAYYIASRAEKKLFTECHHLAFDYLTKVCAPR